MNTVQTRRFFIITVRIGNAAFLCPNAAQQRNIWVVVARNSSGSNILFLITYIIWRIIDLYTYKITGGHYGIFL